MDDIRNSNRTHNPFSETIIRQSPLQHSTIRRPFQAVVLARLESEGHVGTISTDEHRTAWKGRPMWAVLPNCLIIQPAQQWIEQVLAALLNCVEAGLR